MKKAKFKAYCPFEIGDKVQFDKGGKKRVMTVTDIIAEHSVKTGKVNFRLELDGWYMLDTALHEFTSVERIKE